MDIKFLVKGETFYWGCTSYCIPRIGDKIEQRTSMYKVEDVIWKSDGTLVTIILERI